MKTAKLNNFLLAREFKNILENFSVFCAIGFFLYWLLCQKFWKMALPTGENLFWKLLILTKKSRILCWIKNAIISLREISLQQFFNKTVFRGKIWLVPIVLVSYFTLFCGAFLLRYVHTPFFNKHKILDVLMLNMTYIKKKITT